MKRTKLSAHPRARDGEPGWLERNLKDPEFRRLLARENFIDAFLSAIDTAMKQQHVNRTELARRMGCTAGNITQIMNCTNSPRANTMADMAFHLGFELTLSLKNQED